MKQEVPVKHLLYKAMFGTGVVHLKRKWKPRRPLTILGYHQVDTPVYLQEMMGWQMNPARFRTQMEYLSKYHTVLGFKELEGIVCHGWAVPDNAVAITFDDGYRDVYDVAYPILKELNLTATVFVTTGAVDEQQTIWTNLVYYYFYQTTKSMLSLQLPDGSTFGCRWDSPIEKRKCIFQVLSKIKKVSCKDLPKVLSVLANALGVSRSATPIKEMPMLDWNQVRELHESGVFTISSHTVNHPILSNCKTDRQRKELVDSKEQIEKEVNAPCTVLAYPNGQHGDITPETIELVKEAGYTMAFMFCDESPYSSQRALNAPRHPIMTADLAEFAWQIA